MHKTCLIIITMCFSLVCRHHTYKKVERQIELQEVGPRFEMKREYCCESKTYIVKCQHYNCCECRNVRAVHIFAFSKYPRKYVQRENNQYIDTQSIIIIETRI